MKTDKKLLSSEVNWAMIMTVRIKRSSKRKNSVKTGSNKKAVNTVVRTLTLLSTTGAGMSNKVFF